MNHTIEDLLELFEKLPRDLYFFIWNDYRAVQEMEKSGIISHLMAESEYENLYEEAKELVERRDMNQAGVMLIIKDGLVLSISRRENKAIFGLPGGKFSPDAPDNDTDTKDTAIRETREETSVIVKDCSFIYERMEPRHAPHGIDHYTRCYYATAWEGEPKNSEEGEVAWLTVEELTTTKGAFPVYNRQTIDTFKTLYPDVYLKGE